jgi:hypothetical protein
VEVVVAEERTREDEWFVRNEQQLIQAAQEARKRREAERAAAEQQEARQKLRELHFMKCPKCGHDLAEQVLDGVSVDVCSFCEGVFFDAGELDRLFLEREDKRKGFLHKLLKL